MVLAEGVGLAVGDAAGEAVGGAVGEAPPVDGPVAGAAHAVAATMSIQTIANSPGTRPTFMSLVCVDEDRRKGSPPRC